MNSTCQSNYLIFGCITTVY